LTNAGKSSLFNSLCQRNLAVTSYEPDTTSDYLAFHFNNITLVDTVGLHTVKDFDSISGEYALSCDLILYVVDSSVPISDQDINICKYLRSQKKEYKIVLNKVDKKKNNNFRLLGELFAETSCAHQIGIYDLQQKINLNTEEERELPIIALIGRSNVGKSTLLNQLLEYKRVKVENNLRTTRDSVSEIYSTKNNKFVLMDTAGYVNDASALDYSVTKNREASLKDCIGVIFMLDASLPLTRTDKIIYGQINKYIPFSIIAINKIDIINPDTAYTLNNLNFFETSPIVKICSLNNSVAKLQNVLDRCAEDSGRKFKTSLLNKWLMSVDLRLITDKRHPVKIKYVTQKKSNPIVVFYFAKKQLSDSSNRALTRSFCTYFNLKANVFFAWRCS